MSKQALDGFRTKLTNDQALRDEMTSVLGRGAGEPRASVEELVAFASARGYDISVDDVRQSLELSDDQLDNVAGGAIYMKLGDVKGESARDGHKEWIEVLSYSF